MKITHVETSVVDGGWRPWIFVKVEGERQFPLAPDPYVDEFLLSKQCRAVMAPTEGPAQH